MAHERALTLISYVAPTMVMEILGFWEPINKIAEHLYLSRLPNQQEEEKFKTFISNTGGSLGLVVSTVQKRENTETLPFDFFPVLNPTRPKEWTEKYKVDHHQFEMKDFKDGEEVDCRAAALEVIAVQKYRMKGLSALIHCKAGRSRSALFLGCILAAFDFGQDPANAKKTPMELAEMAVEHMVKCRIQVKVNDAAKKVIAMIVSEVKSILTQQPLINASSVLEEKEVKEDKSLEKRLAVYFSNPMVKQKIVELPAYKKLAEYRDKVNKESLKGFTKRGQSIQLLFGVIAGASGANWFIQLVKDEGFTREILSASPYWLKQFKDSDQTVREDLVKQFKNAIQDLVCKNLDCGIEAIIEIAFRVSEKDQSVPVLL